ncbi:hypothetical protein ASPBRDRAFT_50535 [Aspergillus brasiliensis CBS 101740]|uniref:Uncharacterized protein n=1 Tax=Aspergillus brasiliensis (strain CBS 101740 / IMI 381727 / IBT 21946) TaxID=767769 RepID=A0A1L9V196_ASPBC|nr:hypothetical protein ASPBRDRAFT_50535 [Aspergillus brasiliensis CBS 101740]
MFNPLHSVMCLLAFWAEPLLIRIEDYFERTGRWKMAQRLREKQGSWRMINFTETSEAVISLIETNMRRHELLQREAYLKERCQRRERKELSKDDEEQLEAWHKELNELNVDIWRTEREDYIYSLKVPSSPWRRALLTRLVHPEWYLVSYLRLDCTMRGGCCGRDCGCCERPRSTHRPDSLGHCTGECGCCTRARGFKLSSEGHRLAKAGWLCAGVGLVLYLRV